MTTSITSETMGAAKSVSGTASTAAASAAKTDNTAGMQTSAVADAKAQTRSTASDSKAEAKSSKKPLFLIFDLNGTLVTYTLGRKIDRQTHKTEWLRDEAAGRKRTWAGMNLRFRPFIDELMQFLFEELEG